MPTPRLVRILRALEKKYGAQEPLGPTDAYGMLVFVNSGYPASDEACARGYAALEKAIGTSPAELLTAPKKALTAAMRKGGIVPELRAQRLKEIARVVVDEHDGDLASALRGPLAGARKVLKTFPTIGDPGADRILLLTRVAPIAAVPSNATQVPLRLGVGKPEKSYAAGYRSAQRALDAELPSSIDARIRAYPSQATRTGALSPLASAVRSLPGLRRLPLLRRDVMRRLLALLSLLLVACSDHAPPPPPPHVVRPPPLPSRPQPRAPRHFGGLTVLSPPSRPTETMTYRIRAMSEGPLSATDARQWVGPDVPDAIPIHVGTQELFILDALRGGGWLAFYRDPYDASSCSLSGARNCAYTASRYDASARLTWTLSLNDYFSRRDHLEIQDIHLEDGTLYFNEACQSYARDSHGACSSLVALDPAARHVLWRSRPLVSNSTFTVLDARYVVTSYGFTAERDYLYLLDRATGATVTRTLVSSAPENLALSASSDGTPLVSVRLYSGEPLQFRIEGLAEHPRFVALGPDVPPPPGPVLRMGDRDP